MPSAPSVMSTTRRDTSAPRASPARPTRPTGSGRPAAGDQPDRSARHQEPSRCSSLLELHADHGPTGGGQRDVGSPRPPAPANPRPGRTRPACRPGSTTVCGNGADLRGSAECGRGQVGRLDDLAAMDRGSHRDDGRLGRDLRIDDERQEIHPDTARRRRARSSVGSGVPPRAAAREIAGGDASARRERCRLRRRSRRRRGNASGAVLRSGIDTHPWRLGGFSAVVSRLGRCRRWRNRAGQSADPDHGEEDRVGRLVVETDTTPSSIDTCRSRPADRPGRTWRRERPPTPGLRSASSWVAAAFPAARAAPAAAASARLAASTFWPPSITSPAVRIIAAMINSVSRLTD